MLVALIASSQSALFDRPSDGDWLEGPDLVLLFGALVLFLTFGTVAYHVRPVTLERWTRMGYRLQATRFVRTAASMALTVIAATLYVLLRTPIGFKRLEDAEIDSTLRAHARIGGGASPLLVAAGDKAVFAGDDGAFCLYRTIGPYLVVFSDPVVGASRDERSAFLDALFAFAASVDRRPLFYQISLEWIPLLHDRGHEFFKLGEQADIHLDRITLDGHAGKLYRQILRRAERDGVRFRIAEPHEMAALMPETGGRVTRLASDQEAGRAAVFDRIFRRSVFAPVPMRAGGRSPARRQNPGVCQPLRRTEPRRAVGRSDARAYSSAHRPEQPAGVGPSPAHRRWPPAGARPAACCTTGDAGGGVRCAVALTNFCGLISPSF